MWPETISGGYKPEQRPHRVNQEAGEMVFWFWVDLFPPSCLTEADSAV